MEIFFLIPEVFHYLSPSKGRWNWKSPPAPFRSHITELLPFCLLFSHLRRLQSREKSTPMTDIPLLLLPKFPAGCFLSGLPLLMDPWLFPGCSQGWRGRWIRARALSFHRVICTWKREGERGRAPRALPGSLNWDGVGEDTGIWMGRALEPLELGKSLVPEKSLFSCSSSSAFSSLPLNFATADPRETLVTGTPGWDRSPWEFSKEAAGLAG